MPVVGRRTFLLAAAVCGFAPAASAQETLGFGELRLSVFPGVSGDAWQLVERLRPTFEAELHERAKLVATVEAGLVQGRDTTRELERTLRQSDFGPLLDAAGCEWPAHRNQRLRLSDADDYLEVDRLYLDMYAGALDARLGRQAITWGSAQFFNPTDPFPEVLFTEPWRPRRGVNAARVSIPIGEKHDVTLVGAIDDPLEDARAAARFRVNVAETDIALVGAWRGDDDGLVGLDLRGTFGVGWWIEGAWVVGGDPHAEVAVGIDYSMPVFERLFAFLQYYRNGAGATDPDDYQRLTTVTASPPECEAGALPFVAAKPDPFAPVTVARDYLMAGTTIGFFAELSATLAWLQNLNDGTALVVPTVTYNVLDWLDVAASAQLPFSLWGNGGEFNPRRDDLLFELQPPGAPDPLTADLSGLVPEAMITVWTRVSL